MKKPLNIAAIGLILIGALWAFQGLGLVGGSFMTGQRQWLVIGVLTAAAGLLLLIWTRLKRP